MCITDTELHTYQNHDHSKVLTLEEKEKKNNYLFSCHVMRKKFIPLVYSVDEIAGKEVKVAEKHLVLYLYKKGTT